MAFRIRANWCLTSTEALEIEKVRELGRSFASVLLAKHNGG